MALIRIPHIFMKTVLSVQMIMSNNIKRSIFMQPTHDGTKIGIFKNKKSETVFFMF